MRERTIMTLVGIAILAMTSATALADKPAAPARFVDGGATYFLYEGYSLVWNDGGGDEEIRPASTSRSSGHRQPRIPRASSSCACESTSVEKIPAADLV